jgi:hypothetical protein
MLYASSCSVIIIIISKAPFWAIVFLRRFYQICLFSHELDHLISVLWIFQHFFLHSKVISLASNPQPGGPVLCIYVPQWQGDSVIPQALVPLFVIIYYSQGSSGGILKCLKRVLSSDISIFSVKGIYVLCMKCRIVLIIILWYISRLWLSSSILWHVDPLIGNDHDTDN